MARSFGLGALALFCRIGLSAAITACPVQETTYTGATGAKYAICPDTDLQGTSSQIIANIASAAACAQLCDQSGACLSAVYDTTGLSCHVKDKTATLTWVTNTRYDVIRLNNTYAEGTLIAKCPFTESIYTASSGARYHICPDTDYRGASAQVVTGVASVTACALLCSQTTGCSKAVFDTVGSVCHIKNAQSTLVWAYNKQFDVVYLETVSDPGTMGSWSDLIRLPVIPVAAYIVPALPEPSRMLVFSSWGKDSFGGASGYTQFADYNFQTGAVSQLTVSNTQHDMFCPGISSLADGRIVITGGSNAEATSFYNPSSNTFTRGPDMKIARGYQTSATLSDGRIFTIGGSYSGPIGGKNGEVYDPVTNTWTLLPGANVDPMLTVDHEGAWRTDNHGWLFGWKNGSVFQAGPSMAQNWYGTSGNGSVQAAGTRDTAHAMCGVHVMYDVGKIFSAGGSPDYTDSPATARAHITTIGNPGEASSVESVPDMSYPRGFANAVVLPDGTVLVTGGQLRSLVFTDTDGVLTAELFNPTTKTWKVLAAQAVPRNYHAVSILLPDATVFSGGGGLCYVSTVGGSTANCNKAVDHADGQVFSPPYLFNADGSAATRPVISSLSATTVAVGGTLNATLSTSASVTFSLVRIGSVTHSVNSDQRRVPISDVQLSGGTATITLPNDSGILIPGYYYLFALSTGGVPSVAKTISIIL